MIFTEQGRNEDMKKIIYFLVSYNIEGNIIGNLTIGIKKEKLSNYSEKEFLEMIHREIEKESENRTVIIRNIINLTELLNVK